MNASLIHTYKTNLIDRRRAVFTALNAMMQGESLYNALWLWERQFANNNPIRLRHFVAELVQNNWLHGNAHKVYMNLLQCFMEDTTQLLPDPYESMLNHKRALENHSPAAPGFRTMSLASRPREMIVFESVLNDFLDALGKMDLHGIDTIMQSIRNDTPKIDLSEHQKRTLLAWIEARKDQVLNLVLEQAQMATIVNISYVVACKLLGPVKSDYFLARAIENAEKLPEAMDFTPRKLL